MVNENGVLYTIEGVAAGVLMITTAYLVVSTTVMFTPGDSHIIDMQLEQLGNGCACFNGHSDTLW